MNCPDCILPAAFLNGFFAPPLEFEHWRIRLVLGWVLQMTCADRKVST